MTKPQPEFGEWGPAQRVEIERSPVWVFARAVKDDNPVYASAGAAQAAGFDAIPCPPTYTFVMTHAGAWPDLQPPESAGIRVDVDPDSYVARKGLFLHGEQEFVYHRTPVVGDVLEGRARVSKPFTREGTRRPMEFTLYETVWSDARGNPVVSERITSIYLPEGA